MPTKRKTVPPVAEPDIFADELEAPQALEFQSEEDFFESVKADASARTRHRRPVPAVTISFESAGALLAVLTPKRYALFEAVKSHGGFSSIEALAAHLHRDRATVSRDLRALADAGLLRVREAAHPGHGRRSEVAPIAKSLRLELVL